jgi:hypothetical protein
LHALVGQSGARDVAAQLLQRLAIIGSAAHGRMGHGAMAGKPGDMAARQGMLEQRMDMMQSMMQMMTDRMAPAPATK